METGVAQSVLAFRLQARRSMVRILAAARNSFSPKGSERLWSRTSILFNGYLCYLLGLKRPGREVNHPPPSSAEVTNEWSLPLLLLHAFMAWTGENLTFAVALYFGTLV